jgi:hypothetical protein
MSGQDNLNETTRVTAVSTTFTGNDMSVFVEAQAGAVTVTLPSAAALAGAVAAQGLANVGRLLSVTKDAAAFTVTVASAGGSLVGPAGAITLAASAEHSSSWQSDGVNWYCLSNV